MKGIQTLSVSGTSNWRQEKYYQKTLLTMEFQRTPEFS
jgi:hypothetical protein